MNINNYLNETNVAISLRVSITNHLKLVRIYLRNPVYEYQCLCNATYVGRTTCNLGKRIAEHRGVSERTNKVRGDQQHSAIRDHAEKKGHPIDPEAFRVIGTAKNSSSLDILEMLHIKFKRPSLNLQTDTEKLITI